MGPKDTSHACSAPALQLTADATAAGMVGYVVLGSSAVPDRVLRGYHLRCLEATEQDGRRRGGEGGSAAGGFAMDPELQGFLEALAESSPPSIEHMRAATSKPSKCAPPSLPPGVTHAATSKPSKCAPPSLPQE